MAIESDSSDPSKRDQVQLMMEMTKDYILKMGGHVEMAEIGEQEVTYITQHIPFKCVQHIQKKKLYMNNSPKPRYFKS